MTKNLIAFLVPPEKFTSGGIISIFSLCNETRLISDASTRVAIATYPGTETYKKNDLFKNDEIIYNFDALLDKHSDVTSLVLHIPEYSVSRIYTELDKRRKRLSRLNKFHINILNQNIKLMASEAEVASLLTLTQHVTQTTAHIKYTNQELANRFSIPVHLFSVRIDQSQYIHLPLEDKEDIVAVSPDPHPLRQKTIDAIRTQTAFRVIEIENLTFEEYKELVARAKFTLSFGEGMDGYFIESTFSDSIGITAYNDTFFPNGKFLKLPNVLPSYDNFEKEIVSMIKRLAADSKSYKETSANTAQLLNEIYGEASFKENVRQFYREVYSFTPASGSREQFIATATRQKDAIIGTHAKENATLKKELADAIAKVNRLQADVEAKDKEIAELVKIADERYATISAMRNSIGWKVTKPMRVVTKLSKKKRR